MRRLPGRSREGAWIEIVPGWISQAKRSCRSREGAWIEMIASSNVTSFLSGRSREGAWIEIIILVLLGFTPLSLP